MSSLKEIKIRIATVRSTLKITSAMKMISSVKLRRAQYSIANLLPYQKTLDEILNDTISNGETYTSPFLRKVKTKRVAIIAISSNTTMCGAFNSNIINTAQSVIDEYTESGFKEITIYTLGKILSKHFAKTRYKVEMLPAGLIEKPDYESSCELAERIMNLYQRKEIDKVEIIYNHFKSRASQVVTREQYLPYPVTNGNPAKTIRTDEFIFEPGRKEVAADLIEKILKFKIFSIISDSSASEHAARTLAMQIATDNADNIIEELTLQYNKSRQQAITNELLDIMGGFR